jgi:HD-like signal output (HDOD) protein
MSVEDAESTVRMPVLKVAEEPASAVDPIPVLEQLAAQITSGEVNLPSFPDVAARVQRVLEDARSGPAQVAKVISADAAFAARILRLSNSAFLNPAGKPVNDLHHAVTRIGHQLVRCTAVSFATQQMKFGSGDPAIRPQLQELWRAGTLVAAIAYVLARETRAATPDEALVAGLMHNIGMLYITARAPRRPGAGADPAWDAAVRIWHPRIAGLILRHWKFAPGIVGAVVAQYDWDRETDGSDRLTDVLSASIALVPCVFKRELLDEVVPTVRPFERLSLQASDCQRLLGATAEQIKSLHAALSG